MTHTSTDQYITKHLPVTYISRPLRYLVALSLTWLIPISSLPQFFLKAAPFTQTPLRYLQYHQLRAIKTHQTNTLVRY